MESYHLMKKSHNEDHLVARLRAGDQAAWREFVAASAPVIRAVLWRHTHDDYESEELAFQALHNAHRAIGRFRGDCALATWVTGIARNLAYNRFHHHRRRCRHLAVHLDAPAGPFPGMTVGEAVPDEAPGPEELADLAEVEEAFRAALPALPPKSREVLILRAAGDSYEEIAAKVGVGVGTVKSRVSRARDYLRERMRVAL